MSTSTHASAPGLASASASLTITSRSPEETRAWGRLLGTLLPLGTTVALRGDLGAGKTTLAQGIAAGFGVDARITSPTFTLVNEYDTESEARFIHIDTYRLPVRAEIQTQAEACAQVDAELEALAMGLDELLEDSSAVYVIEWAERIASLLPPDTLYIALSAPPPPADSALRTAHLTSAGANGAALIHALARQI